MARRRGIASFFEGFNAGYGLVNKIGQDAEMRKIADAKPTETSGEVVPYSNDAVPGGFEFLGKKSATPFSEDEISAARSMAMGGVLQKFGDPITGLKLQQQVKQGLQADQQFGWAKKRFEREETQAKRDDDHKAAIDKVDKDVASWSEKRLTSLDGTVRDMTIDDQLAAGQYRVSKLIAAGKLTEANALAKDNMSMASNKIQLQTQERNEALGQVASAVAAGDLSKVADFYARYVPDGAKITGVEQGPKGEIKISRETVDGRAMSPHTFKSKDELLAGLNVFRDPMSLYNFSQAEFARSLQQKASDRADAAQKETGRHNKVMEGFAGAGVAHQAQQRSDQVAQRGAMVAYEAARQSGDSNGMQKALLDLIRAGGVNPETASVAHAPAQVQLAKALLRAGVVKSEADGLRMALQSKTDSPQQLRAEIYGKALSANAGNADAAREATEAAMKYLMTASGEGGGASVRNVTRADVAETAKTYGISEDEVMRRLGLAAKDIGGPGPGGAASARAPSPTGPAASPTAASAAQPEAPEPEEAVALDRATEEFKASLAHLNTFGSAQRSRDPAGYQAAQARYREALNARKAAEHTWGAAGGGVGPAMLRVSP